MVRPRNPSSPMRANTQSGKVVSSHSSECGASSLTTNAWIDSRSCSCSSVKMKWRSGAVATAMGRTLFDVEELAPLVLDLQRRVVDAEALAQQGLQVPADGVAVVVGAHEHVRGQGREAGGDLPDVQVVHLADTADGDHRAPD